MFDAACAALLAAGQDVGKTHRGVLAAFSERLVRFGLVPKEKGRLLKQAEALRNLADYGGAAVQIEDAQEMVRRAEDFVAAVRAAPPP